MAEDVVIKELKAKISACEEKLGKYEEILEKVMEEKKFVGTVAAGPDPSGYWRVKLEDAQGNSLIIPVGNIPDIPVGDIKIGSHVMINDKFIISVLPDELEIKADIPKFNFIEWSDIGGLKSQVAKIREAVENPIKYRALYEDLGITPIKGILLYGPAGTGKTLIAKAVASTMLREMKEIDEHSFIYVKGAQVLAPLVGVAEERIRNMFYNARKHAEKTGFPSVIFIDEADAILPERGSRISSDVDKTIVPTFLSEMDGFEANPPLIILATNKAKELDKAVTRPGRIDLHIKIDRPTLEDSLDIFTVHLNKTKILEEISILANKGAELSHKLMPGKVTGATIATVVKRSAELSIGRRIKSKNAKLGVTFPDLEASIYEHAEKYATSERI